MAQDTDLAIRALKEIAIGQKLTKAGNTCALTRFEMETIAREACDALGISYGVTELRKAAKVKTLVWVRNRAAAGSKDATDPSPQIIHDMDSGLVGPKVEIIGTPVKLSEEESELSLKELAELHPAPSIAPEED